MPRKPKTTRKELTPVQKSNIWTLHEEGHNASQIHRKTGYHRSTIGTFLSRHTLAPIDGFESKPGRGAMRKVKPQGERNLLRIANEDTRMTLKALATPSKSGVKLHPRTVARILKFHGKAKRRPRKKSFLTKDHRRRRRVHCRAVKAMKRDNRKVCWSDEVTFEVGESTCTFGVTRGPGREEEYAEKNLRPTFKSGQATVGVWSCFCGDEMGPLCMLPEGEIMTAKRYKWVLQKHFIPFYERMRRKYGDEVVMQEDNAPWHTANVVKKYLERKRIHRMVGPAQSPDLNPIENLWKYIKDIISKRKHRVKPAKEMREVLKEVWPDRDGNFLLRLCDSVPRRWEACLKNKGGATKY